MSTTEALAFKTYPLVQASAILGISRITLHDWVTKQGCPAVAYADRKTGTDWEISPAQVFKWRINKAVQDALAGYQQERGTISKAEADRRRAVALAITSEVDADQALGVVVSREDAEADMAAFCSLLKSGLSNAAAKVASRAAAMNNASEIQHLTEVELNRAYEAAEGELRARWSQDDTEKEPEPEPN